MAIWCAERWKLGPVFVTNYACCYTHGSDPDKLWLRPVEYLGKQYPVADPTEGVTLFEDSPNQY